MSEEHETSGAHDARREGGGATESAAPPARDAPSPHPAFAVVGIGASAGGPDAFRSLFAALPGDAGMAYVVVQHLAPEHPSILPKTLVRFTSMPVVEIEDGMPVAPNRVYVMPSNAEVMLANGALRLVPRPPSPAGRLPIDVLFRSLAAELHSRAIGVVLSGTGEDGTRGLKEIKAEGGITFAQSPASAQFSGMPESAFAAGVVDRVLPPNQIAHELARLSRHPYVVERPGGDGEPPPDRDAIVRIVSLIRRQSGVDFSEYKTSTVGRRVARRMALHRIDSVADYGDLVEKEPGEARALSQDLLIHVTRFFRDPEVFEALEQKVFPALLENRRGAPIRVWVPGCSTGEEVYSLAKSTNEELESAKEELQAANEELTTLNDELRSRNSELDRLANDLSNILEAVDIPIVIVDADRKIRRFTPDARSILSLVPSDLGRPIDQIKLNVDVPDLDRRIAEVTDSEKPGEWEVQDAAGRWFRMQIRPYEAGDGGLDGAVLSFVDVDVLKQAVRDAQSARDYARAIVETVQVPLLVVDDHHRVVSSNPAFDGMLGARVPVRAGDDLFVLSGRAWDLEPLRRAVRDALAGKSPQPRVEIQRDLPGLEKRTFAVAARRVEWSGGRAMALLAFEDLTEQRRLEEERTARVVAETSNRTKDLFLATLSHELRTPLSTILMQAQALRRAGRTDPKVVHAGAAIERAATLQKRLIDDLLDVSRIVSGKLRLDQHAVDLASIVEGAVEEGRPSAEAKEIALDTDIAPGLTAVYADPARMQQVVSNLLTNAIKFTPRSGTVSVTLERSAGEARVTVRDNGMGVRREFLPHLFSRFTQADSSATRVHGGLGLGLAIVKHLVDLHGGSVGADSDCVGRGATFWVTLPLVNTRTSEQAVPPPAKPDASVSGLRVLVVEDDEGTRECLLEVLSDAGATVRVASTVPEGIEALSAFKPDVLLSDLAMPGQDGFSLIAHLRSLPPDRGGRIPAAALSALAGVDDRQHALAAGFQMHIPKPVDIENLLSAVARLATLRQE